MIPNIASIILKFISLGIVIAAAVLWASSNVNSRPKIRDEQTLIGGALWSQTQIPIGLIISMVVDEKLYLFLHAYLQFAGFLILSATGIMLITLECKKLGKQQSTVSVSTITLHSRRSFDKTYFSIGVLTQVAALLTLADFILILIK